MPAVAAQPEDVTLALSLADIADAITLARYRADDLVVETKPDLTPVTEADTAVEQVVRDRLAAARPGDSVVGEEYGAQSVLESDRRWIIDPIDGTKNYVRGLPVWATLLALQQDDESVIGVVSAPALRRRWWASRGNGAFVADGLAPGDRALAVSGVRDVSDAQLSFAGLEDWLEIGRLDPLLALVRSCWRTRSVGDFWAYMLVAEGAMDIALDPVVSLWDLAAPQVIVEEAGGRFTDLTGARTADGGDAIATNGLLHDAAIGAVGR
jgi:histidinol-phosphatase